MAVNKTNKRPSSANPYDEPVNKELIDKVVAYLNSSVPGYPKEQLRDYAIFLTSGKQSSALTNENIGYINSILNPNSFALPNPTNVREIDDYFYGSAGPQLYKQYYQDAFNSSAPTIVNTEKEIQGLSKDQFSFRRAILEKVKSGASLQSILGDFAAYNTKVIQDPALRKTFEEQGYSTPFDNLDYSTAENFIKTSYSEFNAAKNAFKASQKAYLNADPDYSKGLPGKDFKFGLTTDFRNKIIKHPLADFAKSNAEEFAIQSVAQGFPELTIKDSANNPIKDDKGNMSVISEILSPTDRPERMAAARTVKTFPNFLGKVTPRQLKNEAFKVAAQNFLNISIKDAAGNPIKDAKGNIVFETPRNAAFEGRVITDTFDRDK